MVKRKRDSQNVKSNATKDQMIKKPFFIAGVSLILIVFLSMISTGLNIMEIPAISVLFAIIIFSSSILTFVGYYYLGKRYQNKLLMFTVIAGFCLYILFFMLSSHGSQKYEARFLELNETISTRELVVEQLRVENASLEVIESFERETIDYLTSTFLDIFIVVLVIYFIFSIYLTVFGVGLIKLEDVKNAKIIGIFIIISVWLVPTIIGLLLAIPLLIASYVLSVLMFFKESRKAKE